MGKPLPAAAPATPGGPVAGGWFGLTAGAAGHWTGFDVVSPLVTR
jgi:hypothetical protein